MSRFNAEAYDKIFPRSEDVTPVPETAVETFRPSQAKEEGKDPDFKEDTVKSADPIIPEDNPLSDPEGEGGLEDGHAEHSESDSE